METSVNGELLKIYDQIRRLQNELTELAKEFYEASAISYDEISGTPETLSSFENDMNYISTEEVDRKIESIPPIDNSNYLKKKDESSQECTILTHFKDITTTTLKKDDCSDNVATTLFVHNLIEESSKNTEKYISGIYSRNDGISSALMKDAIRTALRNYYNSREVDSKIEQIVSELYIPTKTSLLLNDSGFITINDVPGDLVTSVNGQTGDVNIQIPTVPTLISAFTNDAGYITDPGVTSVNNQTGAVYVQENVQANWNSTTGLSAILNKPALRRVATTGSYNDLDDKPTIPTNTSLLINDSGFLTEQQDISGKADIEDLAVVAFSGSYIDLSNKPTIPTNLSELTNDNNFATLSDVQTEVSNLVDLAPETLNTLNELALALGDDPNFATTVTAQIGLKQDIIADLETIRSGAALGATALQSFTESDPTVPAWAKESSKPSYSYNEITDKPDFATVATSGDYDDLSNKPTIPTVPTNVSAFINDAGYLTDYTETDPTVPSWAKAANKPSYTATEVGALPDDTVLFSGDYNDLNNKPTIPDDSTLIHKDIGNGIVETGLSVHEIDIYRAKIQDDDGNPSEVLGTLIINNDDGSGEILLEDEYNNGFAQIKRKNGNSFETLQQALDARNNVQADWSQTTTTAADYIKNKPTIPTAPGTLNTNNATAQTVSSSESLSGTIKLHKVAKTGKYGDLLNKPFYYYPETTTVPNVTSVGSASTWNFAMGTGSDEHTLIISGGNGSAPSLGTIKTVATGKLTSGGISQMLPLYTDGVINGGGSND